MWRLALYFYSELLSFCAIFRKRRGWEARVLSLGVPSSILATGFVLGSNPRPRLKDSQLVRLLPDGNLNYVMFHLYCLFHKSPTRVKIMKYLYPHILPFLTFLLLWVPGALGSITSRCSGKWARTHPRGGSKTGPGRRRKSSLPALLLEPWFLFWAPCHPLNCATILFIYVLHQLWRVLWILATLFRMSDFWGLGTQPGGVRHPRPPSIFLKFHVPTTPLNLRCMVVTSKWYLLLYCSVCLPLKVWWVWQFRTRCQSRTASQAWWRHLPKLRNRWWAWRERSSTLKMFSLKSVYVARSV